MDDDQTEENNGLSSKLKHIPTPHPSYMMIGFLIIAVVSGWLNLQQARTVDSYGDVLSAENKVEHLENQISALLKKKRKPETKPQEAESIDKKVKDLNTEISTIKEDIQDQRLDVKENAASVLNGSWFWTLLVQIGSAAFGIGVINILLNKKEDQRLRSAAMFVIGSITIFLLFSRFMSLSAISDLIKLTN